MKQNCVGCLAVAMFCMFLNWCRVIKDLDLLFSTFCFHVLSNQSFTCKFFCCIVCKTKTRIGQGNTWHCCFSERDVLYNAFSLTYPQSSSHMHFAKEFRLEIVYVAFSSHFELTYVLMHVSDSLSFSLYLKCCIVD